MLLLNKRREEVKMLGQYYVYTGTAGFFLLLVALGTGLFGRTLRKKFPGVKVLLVHKTSAILGLFLVLLHVLGVHGFL